MAERNWRTSSYSGQHDCVEVALTPGVTAIRDSKDRDGGQVRVSAERWRSFLAGVKDGCYDT